VPDLLRQGLSIQNKGCDSALYQKLQFTLASSYVDEIGGPIGEGGGSQLTLTPTGERACRLALSDPRREPAYSLTVRYESPKVAPAAGEDSGRTVGQFYWNIFQANLIAKNLDAAAGRSTGHNIPAATSLLLAGAPFIFDEDRDNDRPGWLYAGLDTAGLVCGGAATIWSVIERNRADSGDSAAFGRAQTLLGVAYGCLATSLAARLISTLHYALR
jgi:hypothetical protein